MKDKYEPIRRMSDEDRKAIYQFAIKRSREMLAGINGKLEYNLNESKSNEKKVRMLNDICSE